MEKSRQTNFQTSLKVLTYKIEKHKVKLEAFQVFQQLFDFNINPKSPTNELQR